MRRPRDPRSRLRAWSYVEIIVAPDASALDSREQARAYVFTPGEGAARRYASGGWLTR